MAIVHVHWMGMVNHDIEFTRDENGNTLACTFSIRAKENSEWIPVDVYIDDYQLVRDCERELVAGSTVWVNGIMEISFHKVELTNYKKIANLIPVITSNMTVIAREICIVNPQKIRDSSAAREKTTPVVCPIEPVDLEYTYDINEELPF